MRLNRREFLLLNLPLHVPERQPQILHRDRALLFRILGSIYARVDLLYLADRHYPVHGVVRREARERAVVDVRVGNTHLRCETGNFLSAGGGTRRHDDGETKDGVSLRI